MDLIERVRAAETSLQTEIAALEQLRRDPNVAADRVAEQQEVVNNATVALQGLREQRAQQAQQQLDPQQQQHSYAVPNQPNIPAINQGEQWSLANFMKSVPNYNHQDVSWEVFMDQFRALWNLYPSVRAVYAKNVLYTSLRGEAMKMASPQYNPTKYPQETFEQYAALLRELFEPASESEQSKLAFEARHQLHGEHPSLYYSDKVQLYKRAYRDGQRDYNHLYNKVISGLINQEMRNYLRLKLPVPLSDTNLFRNEIMFIATVVRRKYLDGEISESEAIGAEAFMSLNSHVAGAKEATLGKQVNAVAAVYDAKTAQLCYHCKSKDHFIAQCPRRAAGLPATVQAMPNYAPNPPFRSPMPQAQARRVSYNTPTKNFGMPPVRGGSRRDGQNTRPRYNQVGQNRRYYQQRGRAGQIMFVYENEEGELECTDLEREGEAPEENVSETLQDDGTAGPVQQVCAAEPQEDQSDYVAHYVPRTFLGQ